MGAGRVANDAGHNLKPGAKSDAAPPPSAPGSGRPRDEAYRPQFHFTYQKGCMSDINGLFYYGGEYHFFSQHNPAGLGLDYPNIHWGHAVSRDLLHWTELPPVLAPDKDGPIFSGSSVVKRSGFGQAKLTTAILAPCRWSCRVLREFILRIPKGRIR